MLLKQPKHVEPFKLFYDTGHVVKGGGPGDPMVPVTIMVPLSYLEAPTNGLQFIIERQADDCNYSDRHLYHGRDFFPYLLTGGFACTDDIRPWLASTRMVKFGRMMAERAYNALYQAVKEDEEIPMNSGRPRIQRPWIDESQNPDNSAPGTKAT